MTSFIVDTIFGAFNAILTYLLSHFFIYVISWQCPVLHIGALLENE